MNSIEEIREYYRRRDPAVAALTVENTGESHPGQTQGQTTLSGYDMRLGELIHSGRFIAIKEKLAHQIRTAGLERTKWMIEHSRHSVVLKRLLNEIMTEGAISL